MVVREVAKARGSRRLGRVRVGWGGWERSESEGEAEASEGMLESESEVDEADGGAGDLEVLLGLRGFDSEILMGLGALVEGSASESVSARLTGANSSPEGEEEELW